MRNSIKTRGDKTALNFKSSTLSQRIFGSTWIRPLTLTLSFMLFCVAFAQATDVGGYIYCDKNSSGSYNSGEELDQAGLEVKIYTKGTNTLLKTVYTNASGFYNADPIANGTQVDAKIIYNGTTYTATVTSPTSTAHIKVVCTATTCSDCTSPNLVINPTFDSNSNDWTATNGELTTATGGPSALGRYLLLNNSDKSGNYSVYQDVPFGANKQYNYSGVAAKHSTGNNSKVYLEFYNGTTKIGTSGEVFITVNFNTTAFQSYAIDGVTPANTTKIRIVGYCNGTALKMDNQKLTTCNETPTLTVAKDGDLTCNDTSVKLTATSDPAAGVTYDWTVPSGVTDPGNVATFTTSTPGTYSVKVSIPGTGSCSATKSVTVTKTECPPCTTCVSENLVTNPNFNTNTTGWTATNGELSYGTGGAFGGFLVLNNSDKSGDYYVYQDVTIGANKYYSYTGKAAKHAGSNAKVFLEFYNGGTKIGVTSEFVVTKNYDGTFQDITPFVGYTPANTTKIRIVGYANGTALKLDNQGLTTCYDTPTVTVVNDGKITCLKPSAKITATASPSSGVTYAWTVPSGATDPGNVASFNATVIGTYTVKITLPGTGAGCTATASTSVTEDKTPPTVTIVNDGPLSCSKKSVTISATPTTDVSYVWTVPAGVADPGNVASFSSTKEGTYTVVIKNNSNGCTATKSTTVTTDNTVCCLTITNPVPTVKSICAGASVTFSATTNAVSPVEIEWVRFDSEVADPYTATGNGKTSIGSIVPSGGSATISSTNFPAVDGQVKTYYVYACFKNAPSACKGFVKHQINVVKPAVTATGGAISCITTSVQLTATGTPTTGVTSAYSWTGPGGFTSSSQNPTVSVAGSYEVTYSVSKDGTTCTVKATTIVTGGTDTPNVSAGADKVITCLATTATLNGSSTTAGVTYAWTGPAGATFTPSATSATVSVDKAGTYTLTVTNPATGCKATDQVVVTENKDKPTVEAMGKQLTCENTSVTITATGTPAGITYAWTGPGNFTSSSATITVNTVGVYTVTATNPANGCTASDTAKVTQSTDKPTVDLNDLTFTCLISSGTLTATGTPNVDYSWTVPAGVTNPGNVASFAVTVPGDYMVKVTSKANGCTAMASSKVVLDTKKPVITLNDVTLTCDKPSQTLTATVTPSTGVTYKWTVPAGVADPGNVASFAVSVAGTYSVTVTITATGCKETASKEVKEDKVKPTVTADGGQLTCVKTSLSITANGSPATVTYSWTGPGGFTATTKTITASAVGTYTVTVLNPSNGCTASDTANVTLSTDKPTVTAEGGQLTCVKTSLSITASGSPASVTYSWSGPGGFTATTKTITAGTAGTYTVTVTNPANGCTASDTAVVSQSTDKPTVRLNEVVITCEQPTATLTATASPAGVTYQWTVPAGVADPGNVSSFAVSVAGNYTVVVTAPNGCTATATTKVTGSTDKPTVTANGGVITCEKTSLTITATGSPATVTYAWSGPGGFTASSNTINVSSVGVYTVTVTNPANGCTASDTAKVTQDTSKPTVTAEGGQLTCEKTSVSITASGSPASVTYSWSGPGGFTATTKTITAGTAGTYTVTVTNPANGCTASDTAVVSQSTDKPTVRLNEVVITCEQPTATLTATASPAGVTYQWTVPAGVADPGNVSSFAVSVAGNYTVVVTAPNGCTATATTKVTGSTDKPTVTVSVANQGQLTCDKPSLVIKAKGTPQGVTYMWTGPGGISATTDSITASVPGIYKVVVTNPANGCTVKDSVTISQSTDKPTVTLNDVTLTCDKPTATLIATATPSTGITYKWTVPAGVTNPGNVASFTVTTAGEYTVMITSALNGCTASATTQVKQSGDKPDANPNGNITLVCKGSTPITTATLDAKPFPGAQWSQVGTTPSVVVFTNISDPKTSVSGLSVGTYKLVWKTGDCADTLTIIVPNCTVNCVKPEAGPDVTVCAPATSSDLPDAGTNQTWIVGAQNPAPATIDAQTGAVSGLTKDGTYSFILKDSNIGATCSDTVLIVRGIANMPADQSTCNDTLTLASVAGGTYSVMTGNPAPATITAAGKITGLSATGVYKFLITKGQCTDTVKVEKLNCTKVYDLALDKSISKKVAQLGDTLTYTIRVWNEGEATAHGIEVTDTLNTGVQYLSYTSSVGTYTAGKWKFDSIAVGDTVSLLVKVRVVAQGVWFNTAEITKMTEKDKDSTPGNGVEGEDDIDRECFTVPIELCRGQAYVASVPSKYTGVVWFKDGKQVATGNSLTITETGQYTFTATNAQCPAQGCCPILVAVIDCCPVNVCVPVVIKKTRTAVR